MKNIGEIHFWKPIKKNLSYTVVFLLVDHLLRRYRVDITLKMLNPVVEQSVSTIHYYNSCEMTATHFFLKQPKCYFLL